MTGGRLRVEVLTARELGAVPSLRGSTCVVIDAFRSGATLARALENGCSRILLYRELDALWEAKRNDPALASALVGGERKGRPLPGFDFGNSPLDVPERFDGRSLLFSTTNGVRTLEEAMRLGPSACFVGGFVNAAAVVRAVRKEGRPAVLVSSGTDGRFALEDFACAGYCAALLEEWEQDDSARAARSAWEGWKREPLESSRNCLGGNNLWELGLGRDVEFCIRTDVIDQAPRVHPDPLRIEK